MKNPCAILAPCLLCAVCGCASTHSGSPGRDVTSTSRALQHQPFSPPHDPDMGTIAITVAPVVVSSPAGEYFGDLGQTVRSQLTNTLALSPNFLVADREALADLSVEHTLAEGGAMHASQLPAAGELAGADYIIKVDLTEFREQVVGQSRGSRFEMGAVFNIISGVTGGTTSDVTGAIAAANPTIGQGRETIEGVVGFEIRLVDVDRGVVVGATRAHGAITRENSSSVFGIAGLSTKHSAFSKTVIAQATRAAVEDAVRRIHGHFSTQSAMDLSVAYSAK